MGLSNFPNGLASFGIPVVGNGIPTDAGKYYFVNGAATGNGRGTSLGNAFTTIQRAVDAVVAAAKQGCVIIVAPGSYDETVTVTRSSSFTRAYLTIVGMGPEREAAIAPTTTDAGAFVNHCDNVTMINMGCEANGTGTAVVNSGSRFRAFNCKWENDDGTGLSCDLQVGTVAQRAAGTRGSCSDVHLNNVEFCWSASGLNLTCSDYGAVTELNVEGCKFHNMDTNHIMETVGAGGAAAVMFAALRIHNCTFLRNESGVEPTAYILLNGDNANNGMVSSCWFPTALAGGKNLVSTALLWIGNYHIAGIGGAQPS